MERRENWSAELKTSFGNDVEIVVPHGGKFPLTGERAVFILHGEADTFFAGRMPDGEQGFSLPLFSRMSAGALIPPMQKSEELDYYGRCLPDTELAFVPWRVVREKISSGDRFLWNAVLLFASSAQWQKLPDDLDELKKLLEECGKGCRSKLQCVKDRTQELIRSNAADQKQKSRRIVSAFTSLFQSGPENAEEPSQDDPIAAAAVMTAAKSDVSDFAFVKGATLEQRIERSVDRNHVRITPAVLEGSWYKEAFLPMLVLNRDEKNAYCVFRNRHNDPVAWNGANGELYVIDGHFCSKVKPVGWSFVRPFPPGEITSRKLLLFFFSIFRKKLPYLLFLILTATVMGMFVPVINSMIFSDVIPNSDRTLLGQLFFLLLVASLAKVLLDTLSRTMLWGITEHAERSMQMALFDRILHFPVDFFRRYTPGEMAVRAMGIQELFMRFSVSLIMSLIQSCFVIIPLAMLFYYSARLAAVTLGVLFVLFSIVVVLSNFISKCQYAMLTRQGELDGLLERFLSNIGKLHAAGAENHVLLAWIRKFSEKQKLTVKANRSLLGIRVLLSSLNWIIFCVTMAVILWIYRSGSTSETIAIGDFSGFISTMSIFSGMMLGILSNIDSILQFSPFCKWLSPLLMAPEEETGVSAGDDDDDEDAELRGEIELDNVSFAYDGGPQILRNVSLKASPGEFIAITGESGAGKSTLLRLMLRFEKPSSGTVLYDGEDVSTKNMNRIRSKIGVVLQNAALMPDSILHNIIGTTSRYTEEDAWEAAEMAGCAEDISSFPMQMQTVLTGSTISGGQQQRILLAHAMIRRPKLLFLDEATRALDNSTQRTIMKSLCGIRATKVVVAHRLSTIMDADRIYVLERGTIVEVGTYDELMRKQGVFAKMAARQLIDQHGE